MIEEKELLEQALAGVFGQKGLPQQEILDGARYSLLAGGKRLRGLFLLEFCRLCGGTVNQAMPFACAIEMIHAYSLIHDDLPCMDNDDLRRGKPTNHKVYGEAMALLAGDALLNGAYELLFEQAIKDEKYARAGQAIAQAAGVHGMIGGQVLDIAEGIKTPQLLTHMVSLKTGRLFLAACVAGAIVGGGSPAQVEAARLYAEKIGLAFQIQDDILDVVGNTEKLGKSTQSDEKIQKYTFVSALGLAECERYANQLTDEAIDALGIFQAAQPLVNICQKLRKRES